MFFPTASCSQTHGGKHNGLLRHLYGHSAGYADAWLRRGMINEIRTGINQKMSYAGKQYKKIAKAYNTDPMSLPPLRLREGRTGSGLSMSEG